MKKTPSKPSKSTYFLEITAYENYEYVVGTLPAQVYEYVVKKFDSDLLAYLDAVEEKKVPKKYRWDVSADDLNCRDDLEHVFSPFAIEVEVKRHSGGKSRKLTAQEIEDHIFEKVENKVSSSSFFDDEEPIHCFVWSQREKGSYQTVRIEVGKKFDLSKLTINATVFKVEGKEVIPRYYTSVEYDGEEVEIEESDGSGSGSDGADVEIF